MADNRPEPSPLDQRPGRRTILKASGLVGLSAAASLVRPAAAGAATSAEGALVWPADSPVSTTSATLQLVVNPLIRRGSPIHDDVYRSLRDLGCDHVRFVPWKPYPRLGVAEIDPPTDGSTSWDFELIDPLVEDFELATRGHSTVLNFSTIPQWMWTSPWTIEDGQLYADGGNNATAATGFDWTDYTFAVDVTPLPSATHGGAPYAQAGMLFRMGADGSGYGFLISNYPYGSPSAGGYAVFVPFGPGNATGTTVKKALASPIVSGQTYHVEIGVAGSTFTLSVDGATVMSVTDSAHTTGTVGMRENGAESARFDNVVVTAPDGTVLLHDDFSGDLGLWAGPGTAPEDPDEEADYSVGTQLAVPVQTVADYYRRLVSWYVRGGFTDEYGHYHRSGHHYPLPYWEVLNELEHSLSPQLYTELYDAIVTEIRTVAPHTEFVGLAQATPGSATYFEYFLDPANHAAGVPLQWISYHFYARTTTGTLPDGYGAEGFPAADRWLAVVDQIEEARKRLAPWVRTMVDETGTIMNDAATQADPVEIPNAYWNYSAAIYAYAYAELALRGIDVVGESQLVGYPSQYPSVTMLDWTTGQPNARYRVLDLIHRQLPPGGRLLRVPASVLPASVYALAWQDGRDRGHRPAGRRLLVLNKANQPATVTLPEIVAGSASVIDQSSAGGPPRRTPIGRAGLTLGGYAVALVELRGR